MNRVEGICSVKYTMGELTISVHRGCDSKYSSFGHTTIDICQSGSPSITLRGEDADNVLDFLISATDCASRIPDEKFVSELI